MNSNNKIKLGNLKRLEDITIDDMKKYPIWVEDLSGELLENILEGFDETCQRPVLNAKNITQEMLSEYVRLSILIEVIDKNILGSADVDENGSLLTFVIWIDNNWKDLNKHFSKTETILINTIPTIFGKHKNYKYIFEEDRAEPV